MGNSTVKQKIIIMLVIAIVGIIAIYSSLSYSFNSVEKKVVFPEIKRVMLEGQKLNLKTLVRTEIKNIEDALKGVTDLEKQKEIIVQKTDLQRFFDDNSGYFFAYNFDNIRINFPPNKSKNGQSMAHRQDPNGKYFIKELTNTARSGGGFVDYVHDKPGVGIVPKISYVESIPGTDIYIGCGVYIDNIDKEVKDFQEHVEGKRSHFNIINLIIFIVVLSLLGVFGGKLAMNISYIIGKSVKELHQGTTVVTQSSSTVASASQELASGSSEQASSLEEVSASLEELSAMTQQNADNSRQANTLSSEADTAAKSSGSAMQKMTQAISEIQQSSHETQKIIKDIDEIAFQTNLLALNAAVEAARAGEAGKGFAVVAEEVRNLAMRSAEAAKNTSDMIEQSVKNAENGGAIVKEVDDTLKTIQEAISKVSSIINEIDSASREQAEGIAQVNTAMTEIDAVTQRNAANAEESAASSEEMSSQAAKLEHIVRRLASLVGGVQNASSNEYVSHHSQPTPRAAAAPRAAMPLQQLKRPPAPVRKAPSANVVDPQSVIPLDDNDMDIF